MGNYKKSLPVDQDGNPIAPKYDPSKFIIPPSDSKGVSVRIQARCPPDMQRGIDEVLVSRRFPFKSDGDVIRWCVRQGFKLLNEMEDVNTVGQRVDMLTQLLDEEKSHADFLHSFTRLQESVSRYLADQSPEQAVRVIAMAKHTFESMPDGYWKDKYLQRLKEQFGSIETKSGGVAMELVVKNG
jgi:hypothetical protein